VINSMNNDEILKDILEAQKQQLSILAVLLDETKNNNKDYRAYLEEARKSNEEYAKSVHESAESLAEKDEQRLKEHKEYVSAQKVARLANYIRMFASVCLVGLIGYIAYFGIPVN